jgi:flagellar FliJ protein
MKRFEFKLQSLLNYKKHLEEMARQEMARAAADVNACEQRIRELGEERENAVTSIEKLVEDGVDAQAFKMYHGFVAALEQSITEEWQRKVALDKVLDEKRSVLKQRTIDKKAMERLRERRADEFMKEMLREEQKGLDEIAALKTAREITNGER